MAGHRRAPGLPGLERHHAQVYPKPYPPEARSFSGSAGVRRDADPRRPPRSRIGLARPGPSPPGSRRHSRAVPGRRAARWRGPSCFSTLPGAGRSQPRRKTARRPTCPVAEPNLDGTDRRKAAARRPERTSEQ